MSDRPGRTALEVFVLALGRAPEERDGFVAGQCADDPGLKEEVRSLLVADGKAAGFLEPPAPAWRPSPPGTLGAGILVGRFEVVRMIARGGMGTVYEAIQKNPRRTVALKVMNSAIASPDALRRFEYEAQVLARLRHPHIAQVYEAGAGEGAPPFIAMEYVAGARTILEFAGGLPVARRVELMAQVCEAVHHGHTRGVIHRDIKPGNVLVDEGGAPKVIDFGVARAVGAADGAAIAPTIETLPGQVIGTVRYMSPEQCGGEEHAVDTRSDVYALGLVLYELLTGRLPYDVGTATLFDAPRIIRQTPPVPPSRVVPGLSADLETIVLKALEKEPARRYASALALAEDLRRFLAGTAIDARRDSALYVLRKSVRRHRVAFGAGAAILLVLAVSSAALWAMYLRQGRLLEESRRRGQETQAALGWLQSSLASLDPAKAQWRDTHVLREQLAEASRRVGSDLAEQPESEAAMRMTIGRLYDSIGLYVEAEGHFRRALEIRRALHAGDDPGVAATLTALGEALSSQSRLPQAHTLFREALAMRERLYSGPHPDLAYSINREAWAAVSRHEFDESERLFNRAREMYRDLYGDEHAEIAKTLYGLGVLSYNRAEYDRAEVYLRDSLGMYVRLVGDKRAEVAGGRMVLAKILHARGRYGEAEPIFRAALDGYRRLYGEEHPEVAWGLHRLGRMLHDAGRDDEGEPMIRRALDLYRRFLGEASPYVAFCLENLGTVLMDRGELDGAERCFEEALRVWERAAGNGEPRSDWQLNRMACLRARQGRAAEAEPMLRAALGASDDRSGEAAPAVVEVQYELGGLLAARGDRDGAETLLGSALATLRSRYGDEHPQTVKAVAELHDLLGGTPGAESPLK